MSFDSKRKAYAFLLRCFDNRKAKRPTALADTFRVPF